VKCELRSRLPAVPGRESVEHAVRRLLDRFTGQRDGDRSHSIERLALRVESGRLFGAREKRAIGLAAKAAEQDRQRQVEVDRRSQPRDRAPVSLADVAAAAGRDDGARERLRGLEEDGLPLTEGRLAGGFEERAHRQAGGALDLGVEVHERHVEPLREPAADGSRPGSYYINTSEPETRPRYEAEVLAFHEAVPGHHLQIAIAQELDDLPTFRRLSGPTAYIEGWGLYSERLSAEMGLLSGEMDRFGIASFDAWRACRLVVDTGMHALGWSRDRAIAFMLEHTALAENNVTNEVDRYLAMPGQALAYKLGQREILRLRDAARAALGAGFDIREFHDVVLGQGAVGLSTLAVVVEAWIAGRRG